MFYADLHIHSRYSRATSRDCDLPHLDLWARKKGIALVGTGDFTHPAWRQELQEQLLPAEEGLYPPEGGVPPALGQRLAPGGRRGFVVTGEISSIYKQPRARPERCTTSSFSPAWRRRKSWPCGWSAIGNLQADGRPILGLDLSRPAGAHLGDLPPGGVPPRPHLDAPLLPCSGPSPASTTLEECFGDLAALRSAPWRPASPRTRP